MSCTFVKRRSEHYRVSRNVDDKPRRRRNCGTSQNENKAIVLLLVTKLLLSPREAKQSLLKRG